MPTYNIYTTLEYAAAPNQIAENVKAIIIEESSSIHIDMEGNPEISAYLWNENGREKEVKVDKNELSVPTSKGQYDFSPKMIAIAKDKMPMANLIEWNISNGLPGYVKENRYDSIVSTYTLHHLTDGDKTIFIESLRSLLNENGKIYIGDIAFQTREKLEICRNNNRSYWDKDEFYLVYEELKTSLINLCTCEFQQASYCGGVLIISK